MVVFVYRWRLKPGSEETFRAAWEEATKALLALGSGGSALFRAQDGTFWGIARWPDSETRAAAFATRVGEPSDAGARMADCIAETYDALELTTVADLWTALPEGLPN